VRVRAATEADLPTLERLWRAFLAEIPEPPHIEVDVDEELAEIAQIVREETAVLAEGDDGAVLGYALGRPHTGRVARLSDIYVVPEARRRGVAEALAREVVEVYRAAGAEYLQLEVVPSNVGARAMYARWGFQETEVQLVAPIESLAARLSSSGAGASFGSIHVQTDDVNAVERAVRQFVPRLPGRSRGSLISPPWHGWVAIYDDVCDRDPQMLRRLARELSDRMGAVVVSLGVENDLVARLILLDRGGVVDEYLSVPEIDGPLPPGDVIALNANPTVISRLTGADPTRVRAVARTASSPADLPPARDLLGGLADALRIEGAGHGWADAPDLDGAIRVDRD
jgi:ribosomal protein S18 acetylase RimI-like enzyme